MLADMRTEPEPTRPSPLASTGSSRPAEHDGRPSPVGGPITGALRWTVERLAETLVQPEPEERSLTWGTDAGGDRVAYRSWLSEIARRKEQTAGGDARLPAEGPLLSVLVPVYRPEIWYLNACIESVRGQRYRNWELCLCDDASGDEGVTSVLARFSSADHRIKVVVHDTNGGISKASNSALAIAKGEYVAMLDHDDALDPDALSEIAAALEAHPDAEVLYTDNDKMDGEDRRFDPHFKTDWAPDLLLSFPYLGHLLVVRRDLLEKIGGFRPEFDGSQDYDLMLRVTETARRVVHVPKVLYHWRVVAGSAAGDEAAKPWAHDTSRRVLEDALRRRGIDGTVEDGEFRGWYHVRRRIAGRPSVAVVIPFRDQASLTARCLASLGAAPGYDAFEFVLVDNGSVEPETVALRARIERLGIRVLQYPGTFNWSAINNYAARESRSDLLLFMNNDIEARREGWLHALVELAQLPEVGAVGTRLAYPDGVLQHAGVVLGMAGIAGHIFTGLPAGWHGYFGWDAVVRPFSAVTGACMMSRRALFEEIGEFDEDFTVAYGDVDYCMRLVDSGYRCLYTPHAELVHHESVSRGVWARPVTEALREEMGPGPVP